MAVALLAARGLRDAATPRSREAVAPVAGDERPRRPSSARSPRPEPVTYSKGDR